jgi:Tfp pilus assembly protein FimT
MRYSTAESGFTLTEKLILIAVLNILCAIAVPGWSGFMNSQQVRVANDRIYWCFQKAKSEARREKLIMECLIRQTPHGIEYSVNRVDETPQWQSAGIDPKVTIKAATFYFDRNEGAYQMQYNWLGVSNGSLGRIHLVKGNAEACTVVSTLLGSHRTGRRGNSSNPCI